MRRLVVPLALVASSLNAFVLISFVSSPMVANASSAPNVVIIMTDDQRWDTVTPQYMPNLTAILSQNPSVTYTNSFVPNSLCCPSRSSTLTGDYSHTTGVYANAGQWGGFGAFTVPPTGTSISSINDSTTMAVDMKEAGFRTALVGKYLNGYPKFGSRGNYTYVPPGWDRWFSVHGGTYYNYFAATNHKESRWFGTDPNDYMTRVLTRRALTFIAAPSTEPFFLYFATTAPHGPAIPDPLDVGRFNLDGYVQPPSFGQVEAGAPNYLKNLTRNSSWPQRVDSLHKKQLDANYGVDRSIGQIWNALPSNTVVLFMSDNGFSWGEHNWLGKQVPYDESLRIPIRIVGKNLATPLPMTGNRSRVVLNVDVAPTLEGVAGVTSGHTFDGLDMFSSSRADFVLEHWIGNDIKQPPTYCGVRSTGWMYVEYNNSEESVHEGLYDESADKWEMNNLAVTNPDDPAVATELQTMRDRAATLCQVDGGIYPNDWPFPG
jgi:N-acetylglucosamine-6-sulfatase